MVKCYKNPSYLSSFLVAHDILSRLRGCVGAALVCLQDVELKGARVQLTEKLNDLTRIAYEPIIYFTRMSAIL